MNTARVLYHLALADFLERVRQYGFLIALFAIIVVTYLYLPAIDTPAWFYLNLGGARPLYNSAWIGIAVAALMSEFFPLFGFYLVKNTIERDRRTGVGEILATTPISRPLYTLGKWLSNMAVFAAILLVTFLTSILLQFVRAEDLTLDLGALAVPLLLLLLPEFAFIAALAVLFECINWLRGGFGNLVYYLVYAAAVLLGDLQGVASAWSGVYSACSAAFANCKMGRQIDIGGNPLMYLPTFRFEGANWTAEMVAQRLAWIAVSSSIALLAAVFFHRFDPSRIGQTPFAQIKKWIFGFVLEPRTVLEPDVTIVQSVPITAPRTNLTALPAGRVARNRPSAYARMLTAELRLTFKGIGWWWYMVAVGIIAISLLTPLDISRLVLLPLAWVWPVLIWSSFGVREVQHHMDPIVFALPYALRRQLAVSWLVALVIALVMASGVILRLVLTGDWASAGAVVIGAFFIPSLALACGCWSGSGKLFQCLYLFLWYLASVQGVIFIDFMGHLPQAVALGVPVYVAAVTVGLMLMMVRGRLRQITP